MRKGFIVLLSIGCLVLSLALGTVDLFGKKQTLYYYERYDSSAVVSPEARLALCTGQSVCFQGKKAEELIETYRANVLKTETVDGIVSYYCYSSRFGKGISLFGEVVNLQIAEDRGMTFVGTPILFGSF